MNFDANAGSLNLLPTVRDVLCADYEGNPSAPHFLGDYTLSLHERALHKVSDLFNVRDAKIVFTSGTTEGNNFVLFVLHNVIDHSRPFVSIRIEHKSVSAPLQIIGSKRSVIYVPVDRYGIVDLTQLKSMMLLYRPALLSIAWVNHELGTVQPIAAIRKICDEYKCLLHSDMAQAIGKVPVEVSLVDYGSFSAHKINGPVGIGVVLIRGPSPYPFIHGGGQQDGLRAGTIPLRLELSLVEALSVYLQNIEKWRIQKEQLISVLLWGLRSIKHEINGSRAVSGGTYCPGVLNIRFVGKNGPQLVRQLSEQGIAVGLCSACEGKKALESPVLRRVTGSEAIAKESVRISLSYSNTIEEVHRFLAIIHQILTQ